MLSRSAACRISWRGDAHAFKKHHELQFEEDHRINRGATSTRIGRLHKLPYKREVERFFQMPIEVVCWYQFLS